MINIDYYCSILYMKILNRVNLKNYQHKEILFLISFFSVSILDDGCLLNLL